ncbi:ArsR/SmtB family transcription factor [Antribacter gilvus]|uniref:ArsR/SmtB family transcription factor n=1 Tax=Antribacter gilvus TaxID=2304675 RepID=UPI0013DEAAE1|nr:winged helix-turn-helix domain-containing protein [Antribacter gilvus]
MSEHVASSPENIRALTHPTRLKLLNLFGPERELTATECAERIGESVASCSFHLRQLEKYGFVERAEPRGKERPWRSAGGFSVRPDFAVPESVDAAKAFATVYLAEQFSRIQRWVAAVDAVDADDVLATTQTSQAFWATREELDEVSRDLERLSERFAGRSDPALRPEGALRAQFFGATYFELEEQA